MKVAIFIVAFFGCINAWGDQVLLDGEIHEAKCEVEWTQPPTFTCVMVDRTCVFKGDDVRCTQ